MASSWSPLRSLPMGAVCALWLGLGIVLNSTDASVWQKQVLDGPTLIGLGLIPAGVLVGNLFSATVSH